MRIVNWFTPRRVVELLVVGFAAVFLAATLLGGITVESTADDKPATAGVSASDDGSEVIIQFGRIYQAGEFHVTNVDKEDRFPPFHLGPADSGRGYAIEPTKPLLWPDNAYLVYYTRGQGAEWVLVGNGAPYGPLQ